MLELAHYTFDFFRYLLAFNVEDDIKEAVKLTLANEVMIGRVMQFHMDKVVLPKEVIEDRDSDDILRIHVGISPNIDMGSVIFACTLLYTRVKTQDTNY